MTPTLAVLVLLRVDWASTVCRGHTVGALLWVHWCPLQELWKTRKSQHPSTLYCLSCCVISGGEVINYLPSRPLRENLFFLIIWLKKKKKKKDVENGWVIYLYLNHRNFGWFFFSQNNLIYPDWHRNRFQDSVVQRNFQVRVLRWKTKLIISPPKLVSLQDHWSKAEQLTPFWPPFLPLFPTGDLPLP